MRHPNHAQARELAKCLKLALYDLELLNKFDPLYSPRCKSRATKILCELHAQTLDMQADPPMKGIRYVDQSVRATRKKPPAALQPRANRTKKKPA